MFKPPPPYDYYITCPECEGEGRCEYEHAINNPMLPRGGYLIGTIELCDTCEGWGEIGQYNDD